MHAGTPSRTLVVALLCLMAHPYRLSAAELPVAVATRLSTAPVVDGDLGDAGWAACPVLELGGLGKTAPTQRTEVRIGYDDLRLYVAFRCLEDQPEKLTARSAKGPSICHCTWVV